MNLVNPTDDCRSVWPFYTGKVVHLSGTIVMVLLVHIAIGCGNPPQAIRVMTYNIHHGANAQEEPSLDQIREVIESEDIDVVALQEVDRAWSGRSAYRDQVHELAQALGMYSYFGPIYDLDPDTSAQARAALLIGDAPVGEAETTSARPPRRRYGLAILSRFPIVDSTNFDLTRLPSTEEHPEMRVLPGFPHVRVDMEGTTVEVFNTHLDYRSDPELRRIEVLEMMDIIDSSDGPIILMGDFNALPKSAELQPLSERFVDAWTVAGAGDGLTYPAADPIKRIDAVFVTEGLRVDTAYVPETTASDHRPVVVELRTE